MLQVDDEECVVFSHSDHATENEGGSTTADGPPSKRARSTPSSGKTLSKEKVLNSIAEKKCKCWRRFIQALMNIYLK